MIRAFHTADASRPVSLAGFGPGVQPWSAHRWCESLTTAEAIQLWQQLGDVITRLNRAGEVPGGDEGADPCPAGDVS